MACKKFPALFNLSLLFFLLSNRLVIGPPLLLLPGWKAGVFGGSGMLEMMLQFDISLWSGCWSTRWKKLVSSASFRMVELKLFLSKFLLGKFWFLFAVSHKFSYGDLIFCLWKRGQNLPSPDIYLKIDYGFKISPRKVPFSSSWLFLAFKLDLVLGPEAVEASSPIFLVWRVNWDGSRILEGILAVFLGVEDTFPLEMLMVTFSLPFSGFWADREACGWVGWG